MEVAAFIIMVLVVGFIIYFNLPQTKFDEAIKYMESDELELALERFFKIKERHDEAIVKIAEIKYKLTEQMSSSKSAEEVIAEYQSILNLRNELQRPNFNKEGLSVVERKADQAINETYYQYALELLEKEKKENALNILENIKDRHSLAGLKIAQVKLDDAKKLSKQDPETAVIEFKKVLDVRIGITSIDLDIVKFNSIENKAKDGIASIYYKKGKDKYRSNEFDLAKDLFNKSLEWVVSNRIKTNCLTALSKSVYKKGAQYEIRQNYNLALSYYEKALNHITSHEKNDYYYNVQSRIQICNFKLIRNPNKEVLDSLLDKTFPSKNDLMFRYALLLSKRREIEACQEILDTQFSTSNNSEIKKLKRFCNEYYQEEALEKMKWVDEVIFDKNNQNNSALSDLYNDFDNIRLVILRGFPELSEKVEKIKPYIFSRLISQYFEEESFEKIVNHISSFESFYDKPELLKNAGIACLRLANNQGLTESNYQKVISTWLTAVYSDNVILNSLEATEWDDEYTFTLIDSIGSKYRFDNDVDNVNFEEVTNENISIGEVQRELVTYFEDSLNHIIDSDLARKAQSFYQSEKEAIEKIIEVIDTQIIYASPYFAKQLNLHKVIIEHLVSEFENTRDLSILSLGDLYVKNRKPAIFKHYSAAKKMIENCINAIENLDSNALERQNTTNNKRALQHLPKLKKQLEDGLVSSFNQLIHYNRHDYIILNMFESAIQILPDSTYLKSRAADFITNSTISKVNDGLMNNLDGLRNMIKAFKLDSTNHRTRNNLAKIVRRNCMDMLNGISNESKSDLKDLVKIKNSFLTQKLRIELKDVYDGVMNQIRQNDAETAILIEIEIKRKDDYSPIFDIRDPFSQSLNSAGLELAEKLKIIYQLFNEPEPSLSDLLRSFNS